MLSKVIIRVSNDPISSEHVLGLFADPAHGAALTFLGIVRDHNDGRGVQAVSYDAHVAIAEKTIDEICREALQKCRQQMHCLVYHRIGRLEVGEASVLVAVSSPHREESYQASRYIIEELKNRVPIWKQEHYVDGDSEWLSGHSLRAY